MPFSMASLTKMERSHGAFLMFQAETLKQSLDETGKRGVEYAKSRPRFKPRTGALQKATKHRVIKNGRVLVLSNAKPYAAAIDKGARPHIIRPKNKALLRFKGRNGKWAFARQVRHPGNRPYQFLYSATVAAHSSGARDLRQRLTRLAARF